MRHVFSSVLLHHWVFLLKNYTEMASDQNIKQSYHYFPKEHCTVPVYNLCCTLKEATCLHVFVAIKKIYYRHRLFSSKLLLSLPWARKKSKLLLADCHRQRLNWQLHVVTCYTGKHNSQHAASSPEAPVWQSAGRVTHLVPVHAHIQLQQLLLTANSHDA